MLLLIVGVSANGDDLKFLRKVQCQAVKKPILLYNRIHKTGSTSTAQLIKRNAAKLQYKVLIGKIDSFCYNSVYTKHIMAID